MVPFTTEVNKDFSPAVSCPLLAEFQIRLDNRADAG
jgi:hypothetical protein